MAGMKFINKYLFSGPGYEMGVWLEKFSDFMQARTPLYIEKRETSSSVAAHAYAVQYSTVKLAW